MCAWAVWETKFMSPPAGNEEVACQCDILVVGGVSGLTAALETARAGYPVTIVEKTGQLGGKAGQAWKAVPDRAP